MIFLLSRLGDDVRTKHELTRNREDDMASIVSNKGFQLSNRGSVEKINDAVVRQIATVIQFLKYLPAFSANSH